MIVFGDWDKVVLGYLLEIIFIGFSRDEFVWGWRLLERVGFRMVWGLGNF